MTTSPFRQSLWRSVGRRVFACTPHTAHKFRRRLLQWFGADLTGMVKIRRSVKIDCPWNLKAGHLTIFGDHAVLRAREPITLGERCVISQHATLATELLDPERTDPAGELVARTGPITLGDECWIATDTLVEPGVSIESGAVIGARAHVTGDLPGWSICVGQPARSIKGREFKNVAEGAA